jgi:hypothetical protein
MLRSMRRIEMRMYDGFLGEWLDEWWLMRVGLGQVDICGGKQMEEDEIYRQYWMKECFS